MYKYHVMLGKKFQVFIFVQIYSVIPAENLEKVKCNNPGWFHPPLSSISSQYFGAIAQ